MSSPRRILVVDDEPLVCDSVRRMLMAGGHTVQTAGSGDEALERLESETFDVVVVDYLMPAMRGDELSEEIKKRNAHQPIVMISSSAELLAATGRQFSAVDVVLGKPFQIDELLQTIARVAPERLPGGSVTGTASSQS